jgi:cell division protein ZapE
MTLPDIRTAYAASLLQEGHQHDSAQQAVVEALADIQQQFLTQTGPFASIRRFLGKSASPVRGMYLWGTVGRGKTFLMDLFFDTLPIREKKRLHFHRMMHDVHDRLKKLTNTSNPLDKVAADIARDTRVLCFDEFYVSDIADAMLLGRLLGHLLQRGVTIIATSNVAPANLYQNGLQRDRFLPAIALILEHTDVIELAGNTDFRLRILERAGTYHIPPGPSADVRMHRYFDEVSPGHVVENAVIDVFGRQIQSERCGEGVAWFEFPAICDGPRSQNDYMEIARLYQAVIIANVPCFDNGNNDAARRFIALVDEFYDRRVKLILSAIAPIEHLYTGERLTFEFKRTQSRLIEMQSKQYLASPHLA